MMDAETQNQILAAAALAMSRTMQQAASVVESYTEFAHCDQDKELIRHIAADLRRRAREQ